jgi:hypothetical protein
VALQFEKDARIEDNRGRDLWVWKSENDVHVAITFLKDNLPVVALSWGRSKVSLHGAPLHLSAEEPWRQASLFAEGIVSSLGRCNGLNWVLQIRMMKP